MNLRKIFFSCALAICTVQGSIAATTISDRFRYEESGDKFDAQELSVDLAGILGSRDRSDFSDDNTLGVGVGVNYFFTHNFGVGADTYLDDVDWPNHVDLSGLARLPIGETGFAPYALAGVGRQFLEGSQWTAHIGGGVEYRFNRMTGAFLDVREIFADKSPDLTLWRLGMRLRF
jgi:hypothetical protein